MRLLMFLFIIIIGVVGCNNDVSKINYETSIKREQIYGEFSTNITDKTPERVNNITIGIQKLNGAIVEPGSTFSFNDRIGPRNEETGFEEAIIFDGHGNKTEGYGGGLCQISSTLYNAVLNAGLEVVERHEHSRDVPYIEEGKDATVSYGVEDLKFKNNTSYPIKIDASITNDVLTVAVSNNK